jgi:hypothetical protein
MLRASHIATALSAATGRFDRRPNGWQLVGACAYWGSPGSTNSSEHGSRLKPE